MQKKISSPIKFITSRILSPIFLLVSFLVGITNYGYSQLMSCGNDHALALKSDGSIVCWGRNLSNELTVPSPNYGFMGVWTLNTDDDAYSVGLKTDGSLLFWGNIVPGSIPTPNSGFVSIATGLAHVVALKSDGSIVCWGNNNSGKCNVPSPNSGFVAVAAGKYFSVGLRIDGTLAIWGSRITSQIPVPNTGFIAISVCDDALLALKSDGSVVSWGDFTGLPTPNSGFVAISLGTSHATALKSDGTIVCWGNNLYGQCNVPSPNSDFIAVTAGSFQSMGIKSDGSVVFWGYGTDQYTVPSPNSGFRRVPAAPMLLPATSYTSSSFTLHWYPTFTAIGYQIDVSTYADFSVIDMLNGQSPASGSSTSYTVNGLTPGIPYYCRIRAVNKYGAGANTPFSVTLKNDQIINFNDLPSKTYGDATFTVSATGGTSGNPLVFTSSDNTIATCTGTNGENITVLKPGTCTIYASQAGNDAYYAAQVAKTLIVNPKTLTIDISIPTNKVYNGNTSFTSTTATLNGILNNEDVNIITGNLSFADKNAGKNKPLTATGFALSGTNAGNYLITQPTGLTADINKATLDIWIAAQYKIYDGLTAATVTTAINNGLITGDAVITSASNASFDTKNVGTGKTVTADISISGASAENYIFNSTASTTANISKANLIANIAVSPDLDYIKGGTVVTFTVTYQSAIDAAEGTPALKFNSTGINLNADLNTTNRITWTYEWTAPTTGNGIITLKTALPDEAGNFDQYTTGQTFFILDNPNGIKTMADSKLTVYPTVNPGRFNISMSNSQTGKVTVKIINTSGSTVKEIQFNKLSHDETFPLNMGAATAGQYMVEISIDDYRKVKRIVVE
jgi:hypothetical protein